MIGGLVPIICYPAHTLDGMAGLVPAIPVGRALRLTNQDHRHEAGDDGIGRVQTTGTNRSALIDARKGTRSRCHPYDRSGSQEQDRDGLQDPPDASGAKATETPSLP
jgi:hypothetical protein